MEHVSEPVASRNDFLTRFAINVGVAGVIIVLSLLGGMAGYHYLVHVSWVDAFLNASMLLSGMGPIGDTGDDVGKIFAGLYALYSGLVLVMTSGIILAPVAHRLLHKLHVECDD